MSLSRPSRAGIALLLTLGCVLGPRPAAAAGPRQTKVAVLDVQATGTVDEKQIQGLSQLVASQIAGQPSLQVLTSSDIRTMLGFEAEKQLLGCTNSHCLAQIGGALGVGFVVAPEISRVGKTWLVTVVVLDVENARAVSRKTGTAGSEDDLVAVTTGVTRAVLPALLPRPSGAVTSAAGGTASSRTAATAAARASVPPAALTQARPSGRGTLAWTMTGVGGAAVIAGAVLYGYAWSVHGRYAADPASITWGQAQSAETMAGVGLSAAAVGAALVGGSFLVPGPRPAAPALGLALVPGGVYARLAIPLGGSR